MNSGDDMGPLHMSSIIKKAITTFSSKSDVFPKQLEQLVTLFNQTTSSHVNLNPVFLNEATWKSNKKAPMTYIHIFNDGLINCAIFILKPNMKLPLHNHPNMFGLLKVLAGTVNIKSYSLNTARTLKYKSKENLIEPMVLIAEKLDTITANSDSKCCVLDSNKGNIHEIESVNGAAAFIDILSPPYEIDQTGEQLRKCSYFEVSKELEPGIFLLKESNAPNWFWSDSYPYNGPPLIDL